MLLTKKEEDELVRDFNERLNIAHKARAPYLKKVLQGRKQVAGILSQRTNTRGTRLTTLNINRTKTAVRVAVRSTIKAFLRGDSPLRTKPLGPDDVDTAEAIDQYMIHSFNRIPGIEELMYKHQMQSYTAGTGPCKLRYDKYRKQTYFDWILFENCWLDNAPAFALMRYIYERVPMTEDSLNFFASKGEYDKGMVKKLLKENKGQGKDARTQSASDEDKPLPQEQGKDFYDVMLYWYEKETEKGFEWRVATMGCKGQEGKPEGIYPLNKPKKAPAWFGHPYTVGMAHFNPLSVYGIGLPEDIRELQRVRNLIMQQRIDMIHKNLNSPTLSEEDIFSTTQDKNNFLNWELGKMCDVKPGSIDKIKSFPPTAVSPDIFASEQELDREIERITEFPDLLGGRQPSRREPGVTTQARMELAGEGVSANIWTMAISFYKPLLKKFLLLKQQYYDKDEFIRITGKQGERWLEMGDPRNTPNDPIMEGKTFRFGANKEEAVKMYDIELVPSYEMENKDTLKQHLFEVMGAINSLGQVFPYIIPSTDGSEILRQFLKAAGFQNTHKIHTSPDMLPPAAISMLTNLFRENPKGFLEAILQVPVLMKEEQVSASGGIGVSPPAKSPAQVYQRPSEDINIASDMERKQATQI